MKKLCEFRMLHTARKFPGLEEIIVALETLDPHKPQKEVSFIGLLDDSFDTSYIP
jgi:hypothetical protein